MAKPTPTARLRKTFHYPSDDDDDSTASTPEVLDEQEQETLINQLTTQNHTRNTAFLRLLSALPLLSTIPFLLNLFLPASAAATAHATSRFLLPLLGLSSLLATGCMLARLGVTETGFRGLDSRYASSSGSGSGSGLGTTSSLGGRGGGGGGYGYGLGVGSGRAGSGRRASSRSGILGSASSPGPNGGPLETHLPWLNVGLAVLALLTGLLERVKMGQVSSSSSGGVSPVLLGALPGVVYAVVVGAKVVMAGVDPERELRGLRYSYKGA